MGRYIYTSQMYSKQKEETLVNWDNLVYQKSSHRRKDRMLYIESTNAACYITAKTGVIASVVDGKKRDNGHIMNSYSFDKYEEGVMDAYLDYTEATRERTELYVDVVKFVENFKLYKELNKQNTDKNKAKSVAKRLARESKVD